MTKVTVVVPQHHSVDRAKVLAAYARRRQQELFANSSNSTNNNNSRCPTAQQQQQQPSFDYWILPVWKSRVVWNALVPCLFSADDTKTAACLLTLILEHQQQQQFVAAARVVVVQQQQQTTNNDLQQSATAAAAAATKSCGISSSSSCCVSIRTLTNGENTKVIQDFANDCSSNNKEDSSLSSNLAVKGQKRREKETSSLPKQQRPRLFLKRKLRVSLTKKYNTNHNKTKNNMVMMMILPKHILLWIQPPLHATTIDFAFMGRVLKWEHTILRTQSLTGYISTLGGGFFMCRHYHTAVWLAMEQERMALLLNDQSMYYKCRINAAYNYIYAGKFQLAQQLLQQVLLSVVQNNNLHPSSPANDDATTTVLVNMCHSARLFCRRVQKASRKLLCLSSNNNTTTTTTTSMDNDERMTASIRDDKQEVRHNNNNNKAKQYSLTVDDFARIRVFRDQSRQDDLIIPFGHHHFVHKVDGADVE